MRINSNLDKNWDVIVIGGGHAGCEAAHAAAQMGRRTLMVTLNPEKIGFMSCNPAMGGLAKGQLIKEIDALGGLMGMITDQTTIQFRRLNSSKGPAVRSSRAQCDKLKYAAAMQAHLEGVQNLTIFPGEIADLLTLNEANRERVVGVVLKGGTELRARAVIITSGTFLRAIMFTGFEQTEGGRVGDAAARGLSANLERLGFRLTRLKTGTPPRLHKDSIKWDVLERQPGDALKIPFSFFRAPNPYPALPQVDCYIAHTNEQTHEIIEENFDRSPMFSGLIQGVGPRYCPSIEDKVKRFRERDRHQLFLEPEGLDVDDIYVNGTSTSLPADVQEKFIHSINGLESARFIRHGYAVEYDAVDARQLKRTFEAKDVDGLFFAGQICGTSGYEEAGAQGIMAGINAARLCQGAEAFTLGRSDGYLGVLIDDLTTRGADEPYRMFTSRAEYRLLLREDNADLRLAEYAQKLGMLSEDVYEKFGAKRDAIERGLVQLRSEFVMPTAENNAKLAEMGSSGLKDRVSMEILLRRPEIHWDELVKLGLRSTKEAPSVAWPEVEEQIEIQVKYEGYIQRDLELMEGVRKSDAMRIPGELDYGHVPGLSTEIIGRLRLARPETLGQVMRLQGMTPAAVATLMVFLKMRDNEVRA